MLTQWTTLTITGLRHDWKAYWWRTIFDFTKSTWRRTVRFGTMRTVNAQCGSVRCIRVRIKTYPKVWKANTNLNSLSLRWVDLTFLIKHFSHFLIFPIEHQLRISYSFNPIKIFPIDKLIYILNGNAWTHEVIEFFFCFPTPPTPTPTTLLRSKQFACCFNYNKFKLYVTAVFFLVEQIV